MDARDKILGKLRETRRPFVDVPPILERRHMLPPTDASLDEQLQRFIDEAEAVGCFVYQLDQNAALEQIMELIGDDRSVLSWDESRIPFAGLHVLLASLGVSIAGHSAGDARVGISGVNAALAATGSLVLESGAGRPRATSLLPDVHIALMRADQIMPDMETWGQAQRQADYPAFTESSSTTVITGPSKTADIAHQLVKGAHGPRELHVIVLPSA